MEAYSLYQQFAPQPSMTLQVEQHYLLYAAEGSMLLEAEGRSWSLPPARAALIAAKEPICVTLHQKITVCSVLFDPAFAPRPSSVLTVFEMSALARELILECRQWTASDGELSDYARQIFRALASVAWRLAEIPSPAVMPVGRSVAVRRALELTKSRLADAVQFKEICEAVALTPRSLARRFADELGLTWSQSLRKLRMINALEALATTDLAITRIALDVGFTSLSAFNTAFRQFTGLTPSAYRHSCKLSGVGHFDDVHKSC